MPDLWLHKTQLGHLAPSDAQAKEYLRRIKKESPLLVKITKPRNVGFHRKFFALMDIGFENQEKYDTLEAFRKEVVMRAGWFVEHHHLTGKISYEAKSISFAKMDELFLYHGLDHIGKEGVADLLLQIRNLVLG